MALRLWPVIDPLGIVRAHIDWLAKHALDHGDDMTEAEANAIIDRVTAERFGESTG